jgi:aminoglycoside phosphotransferase family enzyme
MRSEMQTLIEETDKQLEPILSDEQMAELKKMREERPQRMRKCFNKRKSSGSDS